MKCTNQTVNKWVEEMASLTKPDQIVWIDGSEAERKNLEQQAFATGELIELDQEALPGCVYHRTAENDVARVENRTFICTSKKEDAGPTNNWMEPKEAYAMLTKLFDGSMKGRTMYVIPYIMGPAGSPLSKIGVELTDSIYVVLNMRIMTRMGNIALRQLGDSDEWVRCLHSKAQIDPEKRGTQYAGLICRSSKDGMYMAVIGVDGTYTIYRDTPQKPFTLLAERKSAAIQSGLAENRLRLVCKGNNIDFYINDQQVEALTDTRYNLNFGRAGIYTKAGGDPHPDAIVFSDLTIREIE